MEFIVWISEHVYYHLKCEQHEALISNYIIYEMKLLIHFDFVHKHQDLMTLNPAVTIIKVNI